MTALQFHARGHAFGESGHHVRVQLHEFEEVQGGGECVVEEGVVGVGRITEGDGFEIVREAGEGLDGFGPGRLEG